MARTKKTPSKTVSNKAPIKSQKKAPARKSNAPTGGNVAIIVATHLFKYLIISS